MSIELQDPVAKSVDWNRRHLLDLEDLSKAEIETILMRTEELREFSVLRKEKLPLLTGKTVVNLFFESSTRTRTSFSLAARRLGADTIDFTPGGSSISKGETFIDTAKNIEAMGIDAIVVRHNSPGAPLLLSQSVRSHIINAGDGAHEHPTQGLLDIFTILHSLGRVEGLTVGLVGDIAQQPRWLCVSMACSNSELTSSSAGHRHWCRHRSASWE